MQNRSANFTLVVMILLTLGACGKSREPAPAGTSTQPAGAATSSPAEGQPITVPEVIKPPQQVFWDSLQTMCGNKYSGQLTVGTEESDRKFGYAKLVIDANRCTKTEIDIGLAVDDDASRTWMVRRLENGLSLHHRHLGADGNEDETSGYGGFTADVGTSSRQQFPADENTAKMIPAATTNVWFLELVPGKTFAYELLREEEQRQFRVVFDLSSPL